jgi:hypothetical protein
MNFMPRFHSSIFYPMNVHLPFNLHIHIQSCRNVSRVKEYIGRLKPLFLLLLHKLDAAAAARHSLVCSYELHSRNKPFFVTAPFFFS